MIRRFSPALLLGLLIPGLLWGQAKPDSVLITQVTRPVWVDSVTEYRSIVKQTIVTDSLYCTRVPCPPNLWTRTPSAGGETPVALGVPFGFSATPVASLGGLTTYTLLPEQKGILRDLATAKAAGARVSLNLTNSGACALDAGGVFRYELWEACFDTVAVPNRNRILAYADSGTVADIYLLDEPNHPTRYGPNGVSQATIERMAAHSKSVLPGVPASVRASPDWLDDAPITYRALDGAWSQYRANRGPIQEYVRQHTEGAARLGLWVAFAINVLDGGTTDTASPLFSGWRSGTANNGSPLYAMSPAEILAYGRPMVEARPCALSGFRFDPDYLNRSGVRAAVDSLARLARRQPRDCTR